MINSKMQRFIWKIEQLDKILAEQDGPVIIDDSMYNMAVQIPVLSNQTFEDRFTVSFDQWGTSTKKVGV